jgi:ubiquinone/menaquinone biosynthesis C-methylase UbiE
MVALKDILPERIPAFGAVLYSWLPARMFGPHYRLIANEIDLPEAGVLLDIGTGPGILPIEIAKRYPSARIVGIDLSEKMVAIANSNKAKCAEAGRVEFKVMDANQLAFADDSLDMVVSTGSMHHWRQPVRIINEVYRCLKPGGEAWIYDGYGGATDDDINKSLRRFLGVFPPRVLVKRILTIHGYSVQEYATVVKEMIARTRFATGVFEPCGVMMRIRLHKN